MNIFICWITLGGINEFAIDQLHTTDQKQAEAMTLQMPIGKGPWHWWEGDPDKMMQAREKLARLIVKYGTPQ